MQNRILLIIVGVLSVVLILVDNGSKTNTTFFYSKPTKEKSSLLIAVKNTKTNAINNMDLEDYIVGVVAAEMPASFELEALKAQAIASRTYAYYKMDNSKGQFDIVTDVSNQAFITEDEMQKKWEDDYLKYYSKIKEAVDTTKGMILTYNDKIIEAYYFAISNGYTEDASLVFSEDKEYLQSVESSYDKTLKNFEVTKTLTKEEFCKRLEITCNEIDISNIKRSNTNRVNEITINGKTFKGTIFRSKLNLRSTDFDIDISNDNINITTRGYGHGVGMSQYGANGLAKEGQSYEEILKYFYKNTKISSI